VNVGLFGYFLMWMCEIVGLFLSGCVNVCMSWSLLLCYV